MKAKELLRLYRNGERNFAGANLRGQSFQGQILSGADFSGADIRGANFSKATLIGANFCRAEAGLQLRWVVILTLLAWILAGFSGSMAVSNGTLIAFIFTTDTLSVSAGWLALIVQTAFFLVVLSKGISFAFAIAIVVAVAVTGTVAVTGAGAVAAAIAAAGAVVGAVAITGTVSGAVAVVIAAAVAGAGARAGVVARAIPFAKAGAVSGAEVGAAAIAAASVLISAYISWRTLQGDPKYAQIRSASIAFSTWSGTSFRGANLTDASFKQAQLKSVDLRKARLTRTFWLYTNHLDRLRPGTSYLDIPQIRTLAQTGQGKGLDLSHLDLRGINLANAQLENASFRAADLSEANLAGANLTRANLVQTQLDQTNLKGAILTGATIEDWNITGDTKLQKISCEYVYMRWVHEGDPNLNPRRKPDNYEETFADGEFGDFIKPIVDTLDLYHNSNLDSRAIAIAFKQLAENNPDAELEIVAIERRGIDKFLLKARTVQNANHSTLSQEYFATYNQIKALAPRDVQLLLDEKDDRIYSLQNFVETALKRPTYYIKGDYVTDKSEINITTRDGSVSGIVGGDISGVINLGEIQGDIHNAIQQLPSDPTQPNLKALLRQLQTAIAEESELDDTEKAAALAQVKKLAEAGQAPQDSQKKQLATKATHFLKGIAAGLTEGAKLVTAWDKVGPAIMAVFGLL